MKPLFRVGALALAMSYTQCSGPSSPSELEDFILTEFSLAQCYVSQVSNVRSAEPQDFIYIPHEDERTIGGCGVYTLPEFGYVYGHFHRPRYVHYARGCERVLRHEIAHALLYRKGDRFYHCWEHLGFYNEGKQRYQNCPMTYLKPNYPKECQL